MGNKGIFSKLHFYRDTFFDKIGLVVGLDGFQAIFFNFLFLLIRRQGEDFSQYVGIFGQPVGDAAVTPPVLREQLCKNFVQVNR